MRRFSRDTFLFSFCSFFSRGHGGASSIVTDGQCHSDEGGETGQGDAFTLRREDETVVAERHNLNAQIHTANDPLKHKYSEGDLFEGTRRNRYGKGPNLQGQVFCWVEGLCHC